MSFIETRDGTPLFVCGERAAKLVSGAILLRYENAAHGLFVTHADRLNRDLLGFIEAG